MAGWLKRRGGFTLIELVVVISIISVLMGILLPVLGSVRARARGIISTTNQRDIVNAVNCFAADNDELYPESVATVGKLDVHWHWYEPMRLVGKGFLTPGTHRAVSEYLGDYIKDAKTMHCANAPKKYRYLEQLWRAGDEWDNPDTPASMDAASGTYCFWWNYLGCLERGRLFKGPRSSLGGRGRSRLLVSCYLGYAGWRTYQAYGRAAYLSCERPSRGGLIQESWISSAYWSSFDFPDVKLNAGYMDGHVETITGSRTVPMRISKTDDGSEPYPDDIGPGVFYIAPD